MCPDRKLRLMVPLMLVCIFFTGCAPASSGFHAPVVWEFSPYPGYQGPVPALVVLADGTAQLREFPRRSSASDSSSTAAISCLEKPAKLYTGPGSWKLRNGGSIEVSFGGADVVLVAHGLMLNIDWTTISVEGCGGDGVTLDWVCGDSGYGDPESTVFRDLCTDSQLRL